MAYTDYHWIADRLAVGSFVSEPDDDFPFDAVLSLETWAPPAVREIVHSGRVDYRWHSIIDGYSWEGHDEIVRRYNDAAAQIDDWLREGKTVLVHCTAGVSRSVTATVWYLMRYRGLGWDEAYAMIRDRRSIAFPNPRFELALRIEAGEDIDWDAFERRIEEHCAKMVDYNVHDCRADILRDLETQGTLRRLRQLAG
jgi:hypothetical protein